MKKREQEQERGEREDEEASELAKLLNLFIPLNEISDLVVESGLPQTILERGRARNLFGRREKIAPSKRVALRRAEALRQRAEEYFTTELPSRIAWLTGLLLWEAELLARGKQMPLAKRIQLEEVILRKRARFESQLVLIKGKYYQLFGPSPINVRGRGHPKGVKKSQEQKKREQSIFERQIEDAYRKLRADLGRKPKKNEVAKELNIGGAGTRLNAFGNKLRYHKVDYDKIVRKAELNK
jgi:hypothetical protein